MDIQKFGAYISKLRKQHDLTQSELADMLNVTRQAVSKWEMGDSFPDISLLPHLSSVFHVSIDQMINYGQPCRNENKMMMQIVAGAPEKVAEMLENNELSVDSVVQIAPVLKASTLGTIAEGLAKHGIHIHHVVELATYLNETDLTHLLKTASFENFDETMLKKFVPFLDDESKGLLFTKIINNELNRSLLEPLIRYLDLSKYASLIEAAVLEGELDADILKLLRKENE